MTLKECVEKHLASLPEFDVRFPNEVMIYHIETKSDRF